MGRWSGWALLLLACAACSDASEVPGLADSSCGAASAEGLAGQAAGLVYMEQVLGDADPDEALPMVVALHGLGGRPQWFAENFTDLCAEPDFVPARLVLLQGPLTEPRMYGWNRVRYGDGDVEGLSAGIEESAELAAAAIVQLRGERPTLGEPIVTGFSQGGMVTFGLAAQHPDVLGTAIPIAGWLPPSLVPTTRDPDAPSVVVLHGDNDAVVPLGPTVESVEALDQLGYDVELRTYEGLGHGFHRADAKHDLYQHLVDGIRDAY